MIHVSSNSENNISIAIILQYRGIKYGNPEIILLISFEKRSQLQVWNEIKASGLGVPLMIFHSLVKILVRWAEVIFVCC